MGLHQNGFRDNIGVFRYAGAGFSNGSYPSSLPINTHLTGAQRNITAGQGVTDDKVGIPLGYLVGGSWVMPQKAGNLSAHNTARIEFTPAGAILGGKALEGSTTITIEFNTPSGELISSGEGSATLSISTNTPLLTASLNGDGSAAFTLTIANATLGAEASVIGDATITITGTLAPYAIGSMEGTTEDQGLSVAGITNSVWNAILSNYGVTGSAGNTLSLAGSGGVDYATLAAAILAAAQTTPIHSDVRKVNSYTVDGTGQSGSEWGPV